ncbi:MAG: hypothetical protein KY469_11930 [Actinobacteria bacterium]|nr:hypothetical protein [Actinomycetota bacterium]
MRSGSATFGRPVTPPLNSVLAATAVAASLALALSGCAAPQAPDEPVTERKTELAERPAPLAADEAPTEAPTTPATATEPTTQPTEPPPDAPPTEAPPPTTPDAPPPTQPGDPTEPAPTPFRAIGQTSDRGGDQGLEGPGYSDLVTVTIEDNGQEARVIVDVAADLPATLSEGEVMGVGVNISRDPNAGESDFQLFADGGSDGWFAYLHTPDGFIDYPGQFRLGGNRLVFQVPWVSIGGMASGGFDAFIDWSQERTLLNAAASDRAPNAGRATFTR